MTVQQSAEDLSLIARSGIERFRGPLWSNLLAAGDAIESADRVSGVVDLRKGCQVTGYWPPGTHCDKGSFLSPAGIYDKVQFGSERQSRRP